MEISLKTGYTKEKLTGGTKMILLINACVREGSRTKILAERLLSGLEGEIEEVRLEELTFPVVDGVQ